jgi:putative endopeptidase
MRKLLPSFILLFILSWVCSCNPGNGSDARSSQFIHWAFMDSSVRPSDNFYLFINGKWIKESQIPPTESSIGTGYEVYNRTKDRLKGILDSVSKPGQTKGTIEQKVGDLYGSGMDSDAIEHMGYEPVRPILKQLEACGNIQSLIAFEAERQKENHGYLISFSINADQKNSRMNILNLIQTGLGLPDRDYYFRKDSATLAVQHAYQNFMRKVFELLGEDSAKARKQVAVVYALEKEMASGHRTNVELRNPQTNYNKMFLASLDKKESHIDWSSFFDHLGLRADSMNMSQPGYYQKLNELLGSVPLENWKAYYRFHILQDAAPYLGTAFVNAYFDYAGRALSGQEQVRPRWERMYQVVDQNLGDGLGQLYVKKYFPEGAKKRILDLVNNLQITFAGRIDQLDWMSDSTKQVAKEKLQAFTKKIGYPDKWRDYSAVQINRNTFFENLLSCSRNEFQYQRSKLGKPVDRTEWVITAPTVDAYYNPTLNEIVFPAGILQPPFFDPEADDALNYGGIGIVIGHEMTHGFDDQGAQYDKDGNLKNWWDSKDNTKFVAKTKMVEKLYDQFIVLDSLHVNGALTTGENIADIGGVAIAYQAFKRTAEGSDSTRIDGLTPDQRFCISVAQVLRNKTRENLVRTNINTDPHSPPMFRVMGPLMNLPAFYTAFHVQSGDRMYLPDSSRIKIW